MPGIGHLVFYSDTVIADGTPGFSRSAILIHTEAGAGETSVYVNLGDQDSCQFGAIEADGNSIRDVATEYGLAENSSSDGAANYAALQGAIDLGSQVRHWFFRGGSGDTKPYYISKTVQLTGVGRAWEGLGRHAWATGLPDYSSLLLMSADDYSTTFNGSTITATATNARADRPPTSGRKPTWAWTQNDPTTAAAGAITRSSPRSARRPPAAAAARSAMPSPSSTNAA